MLINLRMNKYRDRYTVKSLLNKLGIPFSHGDESHDRND
jgi:hypothetical protein